MNSWKETLLITAAVGLFGAVMIASRGISPLWAIPIAAAVGLVLGISTFFERRGNKKSFAEAEKFRAGYAFKNEREEQRYYAWAQKHPPKAAAQDMLNDLIDRYRAPRLIAELLGVLALGLVEIVLFKERSEGKGEPAVMAIVFGLMILLLYFAISNIFGIRARRLYARLETLSEFERIQRSYTEGAVIGHPISYINIGSEYITLVLPRAVIPIKCSDITRVCRANVLTAYYTNSAYTGSKETYFIKLYAAAEYRIRLSKFEMIQAYELLKRAGLPADDTIDMR